MDVALIIQPAGTLAGQRVTSCPIAGLRQPWIHQALEALRLSDVGERILDTFRRPTQAAYDSVLVLAAERRAKEAHELEATST